MLYLLLTWMLSVRCCHRVVNKKANTRPMGLETWVEVGTAFEAKTTTTWMLAPKTWTPV